MGSIKSVTSIGDLSVGQRVTLLADIWDDVADHYPACYIGHKGETLIVRSIPRGKTFSVYVSHEHITDRSFGVSLDEIGIPEQEPTIRIVNVRSGAPYDIYIGRWNRRRNLPASKWANPFVLKREDQREALIEKYRQHVLNDPVLMRDLHELKGKTLACWCFPKRCHGDVLAELVAQL